MDMSSWFWCLSLSLVAHRHVLLDLYNSRQQLGEISGSQRPAESLLEEFLEFERQDRVTAPDVGESLVTIPGCLRSPKLFSLLISTVYLFSPISSNNWRPGSDDPASDFE